MITGNTSYNPTQPTEKDMVRWEIADTNGQPQWWISDEEINALLGRYPGQFYEVCAKCAENIGSQCFQLAQTQQVADVKLVYINRSEAAYALADRLRDKQLNNEDGPVQTGAAFAQMQQPNLRDWLLDLPAGDPNNPRRPIPGVP